MLIVIVFCYIAQNEMGDLFMRFRNFFTNVYPYEPDAYSFFEINSSFSEISFDFSKVFLKSSFLLLLLFSGIFFLLIYLLFLSLKKSSYHKNSDDVDYVNWVRLRNFVYRCSGMKKISKELFETKKKLELALWASEASFWDWNIPQDKVQHIKNLSDNEIDAQRAEISSHFSSWVDLVHPEDRDSLEN